MMKEQYTKEQKDIISIDLVENKYVSINALAGTGKTSTLLEIVNQNPKLKFKYVAFNKAIIDEVKTKIIQKKLKNISSSTIHSLSKQKTSTFFQNQILKQNFDISNLEEILKKDKVSLLYSTLKWLNKFTNQEKKIGEYISYYKSKTSGNLLKEQITENKKYLLTILECVKTVYETIINKEYKYYTHGIYLKYFIDNMDLYKYEFDVLLIDEAQDMNQIMYKLIKTIAKKRKTIVLVGDSNQAIYSFLDNIDLLEKLKENPKVVQKQLLKSFRFPNGSNIEQKANLILNQRNKSIIGAAIHENEDINDILYLGRTNSQVVMKALELTNNNIINKTKDKFNILGGLKSLETFYQDLEYLKNFQNKKIKNKVIAKFKSIEELEEFAKENEDYEILGGIKMINERIPTFLEDNPKFNPKTPSIEDIFEVIKKFFTLSKKVKITLSTMHKSKGLGFDKVILMKKINEVNNIYGFEEEEKPLFEKKLLAPNNDNVYEEFNLLYVALTRAKKELVIDNDEIMDNLNLISIDPKKMETTYINQKFLDNYELYIEDNNFYIFESVTKAKYLIGEQAYESYKYKMINKDI
jgi:F-box protein, helicase, 18